MKYGLFSDIHANLEAFQVVLEALEREKVDKYFFLGDLVGYGADPRGCIELMRELIRGKGCVCIAGNHDYGVCGQTPTENFIGYAQESIGWTKSQLDSAELEFLSSMKLFERTENFTAVHANPVVPQEWGYVLDIDDAFETFKVLKETICFIGHSHRPIVFSSGKMVDWFIGENIPIQKEMKYIINIGSVGQPRDGDPRTCFAIYDTENSVVELKRLSYDISKTQEKIYKAGLPKLLAERLLVGK